MIRPRDNPEILKADRKFPRRFALYRFLLFSLRLWKQGIIKVSYRTAIFLKLNDYKIFY